MGAFVNPTDVDFREILHDGKYIDKTGLIAFTNSKLRTRSKLIAFSRPRRFGKTFAAKMLAAYYSKGADSRNVFEGLEISEDDSFEVHLNKYNVVYLDMMSFISKSKKIDDVIEVLQNLVIEELRIEYPGCIGDDTDLLQLALSEIYINTGDMFYVIIDEWDAVFREAKENEDLQKAYIQFLRGIFKATDITRTLVGAYMTGILPIKKYGTQSALTDFKEYTMLEPFHLAPFIGFTEDEVRSICFRYSIDFGETQRWYDGYCFDNDEHIYCPNSIMELVSNGKFKNYWTQTETYESMRDYIDLNFDGLKDGIIDMLGCKKCQIDPNTFQNDMTTIASRDDVFTLLVHLGYLAYEDSSKSVYIPNEEIRSEFIRALRTGNRSELVAVIKMSDM